VAGVETPRRERENPKTWNNRHHAFNLEYLLKNASRGAARNVEDRRVPKEGHHQFPAKPMRKRWYRSADGHLHVHTWKRQVADCAHAFAKRWVIRPDLLASREAQKGGLSTSQPHEIGHAFLLNETNGRSTPAAGSI
jgi:hypothetical protein